MNSSPCPVCEKSLPGKDAWKMYRSSLFFNRMGSITPCRSCGTRLTIKDPPGSKLFGLFLVVLLAIPVTAMLIYLGFVVIPESFPGRIDQLVELGIDFRFAAAALLPILLLAIYLIYRIVYGILFQFTSLKTLESE